MLEHSRKFVKVSDKVSVLMKNKTIILIYTYIQTTNKGQTKLFAFIERDVLIIITVTLKGKLIFKLVFLMVTLIENMDHNENNNFITII